MNLNAPHFRNPGEAVGYLNLKRVREWYRTHRGGTQAECAAAVGLSVMAVNRHVKTLRSEWLGEQGQGGE